jgi:outer membrane lipoprotein-sorting protein
MRWTTPAALLLLAAPAYGQENEAERLYRAMENKIRTAKSVHLVFEGQLAGEGKKGEFKGSFRVAEGNKSRMEFDGDSAGEAMKVLVISDGKSTYSKMNDKANTKDNSADKKDFEKALAITARGGVLSAVFFPASKVGDLKGDADIDTVAAVNDFNLGAKEKIGTQETQVVHYSFKLGDVPPLKASVWIDTKTQLPVKRDLIYDMDGKEAFRITETYNTFTVNAKADANLFELPK